MGFLERDKGGILGFGILAKSSPQLGREGGLAKELFWKDIDATIEDEANAVREYQRLANEAERLGFVPSTTVMLLQILGEEARHKRILEEFKMMKK